MTFGKFAGLFSLTIILIILGTFTITCLWSWFIVPLGLPPITMVHAYGLSVIVAYFQHRQAQRFKDEVLIKLPISKILIKGILLNLIVLIVAGVGSIFM